MDTKRLFDLLIPFKGCRLSIERREEELSLVFLCVLDNIEIDGNDVELFLQQVSFVERASDPSKPVWTAKNDFDRYAIYAPHCFAAKVYLINTVCVLNQISDDTITFYPKEFGSGFNPAKSILGMKTT